MFRRGAGEGAEMIRIVGMRFTHVLVLWDEVPLLLPLVFILFW